MPPKGFKLAGDRPKWKAWCWVCGKQFTAIRCTAICCSAKCRQIRSRSFRVNGKYPERHPNGHLRRIKHYPTKTISM